IQKNLSEQNENNFPSRKTAAFFEPDVSSEWIKKFRCKIRLHSKPKSTILRHQNFLRMKFIVSSGALLKQLQLIGGVVSANTVLPILEDFLFDIKDEKLTVFSTDLETSMSTTLDVEGKEDGKIAVPAKL